MLEVISAMNFIQLIRAAWQKTDSLVCVGLDPDLAKIPKGFRGVKNPLFRFNKEIVDAVGDLVCAFKPQMAYYAAARAEKDLELTIDYIHQQWPDSPVILDAKRGDIGSTAQMYAKEVFDRYNADAATVNPYMGADTLQPFLERKEKGVVILCRTSNPGAQDIQDLISDGTKLYQIVAQKAATQWNKNKNVLLVVGATFPKELKEVRTIVKDMPLLVPGIGAQGGDVEKAVTQGIAPDGAGMIINSSRGIIYAGGDTPDFQKAARRAVLLLRDTINQFRK